MGFPGVEVDADTGAQLRPLLNLQVWLFGSKRASEWLMAMTPRVLAASPEGLYLQWAGQQPADSGDIILRNKAAPAATFDLYEMVRIDSRLNPADETIVEQQAARLQNAVQRMLTWRAAPPAPTTTPPAEKPWWEE